MDDVSKLVSELQEHQAELEAQNEMLRRTHLDLAASRAEYEDLYNLAPVGYCTVDGAGTVTLANRAMAALVASTPGLMAGELFTRWIARGDQDQFYLMRRGLALDDGAARTCELQLRREDGGQCWAELTASMAWAGGGPELHLIVVDISERRRSEEERRRLEDRLQQAQRMESIGRLAGGVAHDFNNMLGVIVGNVELAVDRIAPADPAMEHLSMIRHAAERSAGLTRQLLTFARQQPIVPKVLDVNAAIAQWMPTLPRLMGEDVQLDWEPAIELWPVRIDRSQLDQIVTNLCLNARDATVNTGRPGQITVETDNRSLDAAYCASRAGSEPGDYVRLRVMDNGRGIPPEHLRFVFEPFFTSWGHHEGTGLGLATVLGSVAQNLGFVEVESEVGVGSTFSVNLPRHSAPLPPASADGPSPLVGGTERVMVVEDEPEILAVTTKMLTRYGYTVHSAASPAEAIERIVEHPGMINLLITDVIMPKMNGRELTEKLQAIQPGLKQIYMSGYTADVIANGGAPADGIHFIQKPFTVRELLTAVRAVLDED